MYKHHFLLSILFFVTFAAAWPWPHELAERDDSSSSIASSPATVVASAAASAAVSSAAKTEGSSLTQGSAPTQDSDSGSSNSTTTATKATKTSDGSKTSSKPKITSIDARLPAGGIQMLQPSQIAPASFYKIGDKVSFAWNYTSLVVTPTAVDVIVSCSSIDATYTLTSNMTIDASATASVVWDTQPDETGTNPLLTEHYTLIVYEAGTSITAVPRPGYLSPFSQFQFAMYLPQSPTSLGEFVCATCSGAMSSMERQTLSFLFGMGFITVLSFSWFAGGFLAYF